MKKRYILVLFSVMSTSFFLSCKDGDASNNVVEETSITGTLNLYVDNTVQPITEDVLAVFHSVYDRAKITQVNKTENEVVSALLKDTASVAVLTRKLTKEEEARFKDKSVVPKITEFAVDAIALVVNERVTDSVIELEEVLKVLRGEGSERVGKLVFDNSNSSTVQFLLKRAGVASVPVNKSVYSLKTNEEVIKYVHDNAGAIGVVGVNWLVQTPTMLRPYTENIKILAVDNVEIDKEKKYYKPSQSNIATGSYPLTRKLYVLDYQGRDGLGTGFAIYISAPEGQRIVLKSGLLPVTIPTREIEVRNEL